jgi:hypothetical protein
MTASGQEANAGPATNKTPTAPPPLFNWAMGCQAPRLGVRAGFGPIDKPGTARPLLGVPRTNDDVVSPELPAAFARSAAYGDLIAAILALLALATLGSRTGTALTWVFNTIGIADLLFAFYQGNRVSLAAAPGWLGATYFLVIGLVPLPWLSVPNIAAKQAGCAVIAPTTYGLISCLPRTQWLDRRDGRSTRSGGNPALAKHLYIP